MNRTLMAAIAALSLTAPALAPARASSPILPLVQPGLSAEAYASNAARLAAEAEAAYAVAFADLPLWSEALANAEAAAAAAPEDAAYTRALAMLYAKTQWWSRAMTNFDRLEAMNALDEEATGTAAFTARKLGVLAIERGDGEAAVAFLRRSLELRPDESTVVLLERVNRTFGF